MTNEELKLVRKLILEEKNKKKLLDIRKLVCERILFEESETIQEEELDDVQIDILLKPFKDFCNSKGADLGKWTSIIRILSKKFRGVDINDFKVYHLVTPECIEELESINRRVRTLYFFENVLNEYNLSLSKPLTDKQLSLLKELEIKRIR